VHLKATSLDDLTANMHKTLSWADIDAELASKKKIKLPDRRSLTLFNSFDIARFRGEPEMWEAEEKNTTDAQKKKIEVKEIAKETGTNVVDLNFIQQALNDQVQNETVLNQLARESAADDARQHAAMMREQTQALQQLAKAQLEAANRHRVVEQVMQGHVDRMHADAERMHQAMAAAGHQRTNVTPTSSAQVHHHTYNVDSGQNTMHAQNAHNATMQVLQQHLAQLGNFMHQQNVNQRQIFEAIHAHMQQQEQERRRYTLL